MSFPFPNSVQRIVVDEALLRARVLEFIRSPAGESTLREFEFPSWFIWLVTCYLILRSFCQILSIYWAWSGLQGLWELSTLHGAVARFRCKEREHPELLVPVIAHGVITGNGVGLVLGTFSRAANHDSLATLAARLGSIYVYGATDAREAPIYSLLRDDAYQPLRRRSLEPFLKDPIDALLFDVELKPGDGQQSPHHSVMYAFVAQEEKKGGMEQIPWHVVAPAVQFQTTVISASEPPFART